MQKLIISLYVKFYIIWRKEVFVMEEILGTVTSLLGDLNVEELLGEIDINGIIEMIKSAIESIMEMFSGLMA